MTAFVGRAAALIASFFLFAMWSEVAEPQAPQAQATIGPRLITLYARGGTFSPGKLLMNSGDRLQICNQDPIEYIPMIGSPGRLDRPGIRLVPGQCHIYGALFAFTRRKIVKITSEIQSNAFAEIWVMPTSSGQESATPKEQQCPAGQRWHYQGFCIGIEEEQRAAEEEERRSKAQQEQFAILNALNGDWEPVWFQHANRKRTAITPGAQLVTVKHDGNGQGRVVSRYKTQSGAKSFSGTWRYDPDLKEFTVRWNDGEMLSYKIHSFSGSSGVVTKMSDGRLTALQRK